LIYPFFLEGVVAVPELNQDDRIHPTVEGVAVIVSRIMPVVEKLIDRVKGNRTVK
jgi:acyl-CoA thioesterase-1